MLQKNNSEKSMKLTEKVELDAKVDATGEFVPCFEF